MSRVRKLLVFAGVFAALLSCTCATPFKVTEIQKTDKKLTCKDVILEINEAENYRDLAKDDEGIQFGNMLMPVCWVSSYVDAGGAIKAADTRIKYLGHIYDVLDCGGKSDSSDKPVAAPPFIQVEPAPAPAQTQKPEAVQQQASPRSDSEGQCFDNGKPKTCSCVSEEDIAKYTHRHTDKFGRVYSHCHVNSGPHRHVDD